MKLKLPYAFVELKRDEPCDVDIIAAISVYQATFCRWLKEGRAPGLARHRGCHCRWLGWIGKCEKCGITRSMSKKGCSSDNSVCEGYFGS